MVKQNIEKLINVIKAEKPYYLLLNAFRCHQAFNADKRKQRLARGLIKKYCSAFVETGTLKGTTSAWVAKLFPKMPIYTCEIVPRLFRFSKNRLACFPNVKVYNDASVDFLKKIPAKENDTPFIFLDAHSQKDINFSYSKNPLPEELEIIFNRFGKAVILIDDFEVPGKDFSCTFKLADIEKTIKENEKKDKLSFIYPDYTEKEAGIKRIAGYIIVLKNIE